MLRCFQCKNDECLSFYYLFASPLGVYNYEFDITIKNGHGLSLIALVENGDLLSLKGRIYILLGHVKVF